MARSGTVVAMRNARQIEQLAATVRRVLGIPAEGRIAMQPILEHALDVIFEDGHFEVLEDHEMAGAEARVSTYEPVISLSARTYRQLQKSDARARMTVAHEVGHLLMHCAMPVAMNSGTYDPRRDPEWQADMFAAALLMPRTAFIKMASINQAMQVFGVSRSAAVQRARRLKHDFNRIQMQKGKKKTAPKRRP